MPDFLSRNLKLDLRGMAMTLFLICSGASVGSVTGGWLSSRLISRGWSINAGRKTALAVCAFAVTPIILAARTGHSRGAVSLIALAAGAHQGWSANIHTLASDMFPRDAVASVVGFAKLLGAISGMLMAKVVGQILQRTGSYALIFLMASMAYLIALGCVQILAPPTDREEI